MWSPCDCAAIWRGQGWFLCYPFPNRSPPTRAWPCPCGHSAHSHPLISPTSCSPLTASPPAAGWHSGTKAWTGLGFVPRERCGGTQEAPLAIGEHRSDHGPAWGPSGRMACGHEGCSRGTGAGSPQAQASAHQGLSRGAWPLSWTPATVRPPSPHVEQGAEGKASFLGPCPIQTARLLPWTPLTPPAPSLMGQGSHWLPTTLQKQQV